MDTLLSQLEEKFEGSSKEVLYVSMAPSLALAPSPSNAPHGPLTILVSSAFAICSDRSMSSLSPVDGFLRVSF